MKTRSSNPNHQPKTSQSSLTKVAKGKPPTQLILKESASKTPNKRAKQVTKRVPLWALNPDDFEDEEMKRSIFKAQKGRREREQKKAEATAKDMKIQKLKEKISSLKKEVDTAKANENKMKETLSRQTQEMNHVQDQVNNLIDFHFTELFER